VISTKRWVDLKAKIPASRRENIDRHIKEELLEMDLQEMRKLTGKTQVEVARVLEASQGQVSEMEKRDDYRLSTLRRYVSALGGELEVIANFGDKRIRLHGA